MTARGQAPASAPSAVNLLGRMGTLCYSAARTDGAEALACSAVSGTSTLAGPLQCAQGGRDGACGAGVSLSTAPLLLLLRPLPAHHERVQRREDG
jgi:hypothetical protein